MLYHALNNQSQRERLVSWTHRSMAVDQQYFKQGYGEWLLVDALKKLLAAQKTTSIYILDQLLIKRYLTKLLITTNI